MNVLYPLISVLIVSLLSVIVAFPLLIKKKVSNHTLVFLLSISVGVLLATVFLDFMPEMVKHGYNIKIAIYLLIGFLIMFLLEKLIHWHHTKKCENGECGHSHAYNLAPINLIGDGVHNFIDGLVIVGSYAVDISLGITATISIIFHEIPQEIADFGVLLYSGMHKKKALMFNFISALFAFAGVGLGLLLINNLHGFNVFIIPFAAGNFLYIAASNLLPQLHRHCKLKETLVHMLAIIVGISFVFGVVSLGPEHAHGVEEHISEEDHMHAEEEHIDDHLGEDNVQIANPAFVNCIENGGVSDIRESDLGQYGICIFSDNSFCDEWEFLRGECFPSMNFE